MLDRSYMWNIYIGLYMNFMDLKLTLWLINKTIGKKKKKKTLIVWMVALIKHSTTNNTNSNNNWCLTNHKGEIFIEIHIIDFMDLKLHLWLISKTIETKTKNRNIPIIVWFYLSILLQTKKRNKLIINNGEKKIWLQQ